MPHVQPTCHLPHARVPDSSQKFPPASGTGCQPSSSIHVPETAQWIGTTTGRTTNDPHSWLTSCHWIGDKSGYKPHRTHGPDWGHTTIVIAKEISALKECRPSVDYLARKLKISERTVQYHLGMLRETGLLVYRTKGTRLSGRSNQASVFERTIPLAFDLALGIRTVGEGVQRRPVGIKEESRTLIGTLAKKAARKIRKPRRRTRKAPVSGGSLCTPMQGGTCSSSTTGTTHSPSESKLASGQTSSPTPKQQKPKARRKLNKIGRRYQLAGELTTQVPWLEGASKDRIAWIVRHVADAGWTAVEVQAVAEESALTAADVRRPSGMLAHRLKGAHLLYTTKERRATAVVAWRDSRKAEQARHAEYGHSLADIALTPHALRELATVRARRQQMQDDIEDLYEVAADTDVDLEALDRELVISMRAAAEADPGVIRSALATGLTENDARRLYTNRLVDQALKTFVATTLNPWMETSRA